MGDAACAFNPVYGQGMTTAAIAAEVLDRWLQGRSSHLGPGQAREFPTCLGPGDRRRVEALHGRGPQFPDHEGTATGSGREIDRPLHRRVMRASTRRPWIRQRLTEVLHLLRPPGALFGPGILIRLAWDWFAGGSAAGYRTSAPLRERQHGGLRPPLRPAASFDVKTAAADRV